MKPSLTVRFLSAMLALLLVGNVWARDKTDVIWLSNGDRLTGEISQLEHGKLRVSTDSMGNVYIEWDDVTRIESDYDFQFERSDGTRITGIINKTPDQHRIELSNEEETTSFAHEKVVRISQIEDSFWERLDGSLTFGYSFTKASDVAQGNLGFRATHRTEKRAFTLDGSTITTTDQADESTQDSNLALTLTRFRPNRWFNAFMLGMESNDALGLDLRASIGAGMGRYLIQTNTSELSLLGGLLGTAEHIDELDGSTSSKQNIEGLLGVDYSRYIFDNPSVDLSITFAAFPSITESGRTRADLNISLRWELISDLFWDLNYYNKYDSEPQVGADTTNDYGIVTSIGYAF